MKSNRERVWELRLEGMTIREIADKLELSSSGVYGLLEHKRSRRIYLSPDHVAFLREVLYNDRKMNPATPFRKQMHDELSKVFGFSPEEKNG